jgi:hypothetical protein
MKDQDRSTRRLILIGCVVISTFLAAFGAFQASAQKSTTKVDLVHSIYPAAFRYAIIYQNPPVGNSGPNIIILMDPSEFSEMNLRTLFGLLSLRFEAMPRYTVYIETSLQYIQTPEEHEGPGYSERPEKPNAAKTPAATIRHSPESDTAHIFQPFRGAGPPRKIDLRITPTRKLPIGGGLPTLTPHTPLHVL